MRIIIFIIALLTVHFANCCSCLPPGKIDDKQFNEYGVIAKGKIIRIIESEYEQAIFIKVETYYKGFQKNATIKIISPSRSGMCGIFPKVGEHSLMYAFSSGKAFRTSLC